MYNLGAQAKGRGSYAREANDPTRARITEAGAPIIIEGMAHAQTQLQKILANPFSPKPPTESNQVEVKNLQNENEDLKKQLEELQRQLQEKQRSGQRNQYKEERRLALGTKDYIYSEEQVRQSGAII